MVYKSFRLNASVRRLPLSKLVNNREIAARVAVEFFTKGKSARTFPKFKNKKEAAIHFADINAGGGVSSHRSNAIEASKKFEVDYN